MPERFECSAEGTSQSALKTEAFRQARAHFGERPFHVVAVTQPVEMPGYDSRVRQFLASYLFEEDLGHGAEGTADKTT